MSDNSHSSSVRGTLDNPKTKEAMKSDNPTPSLGDATSLKPVNDDKKLPSSDSAPPAGQGNDTPTNSASESAPTVSEPYRKNANAGGPDKKAIGNGGEERKRLKEGKDDLPHSKKVRGTLANDDGNKVNKTQLGDPVSLKAETSKTDDMDKGTEREGQDKSGKSKL
ncbi:hypothetical protein EJ02DRAFT_1123 [Clathrospora elynae]|uniref:Uncharacterized protein n=1 Tax=Clathrospora elynae TaxID=706981 RepID=A0A6A5TA67_9PLEO|nr:hypothetical protein EJ02DRAFT_1123 [Clathrospora elynae]